ncbi:hypothetical protein FPE01S_01_09620 [Flavihumibacter petaseus NBRC 106054]|uniref:Choline kinase n=1 Tax=Flavihumibacter petaseus NBRC 106054 TaxID=1220578 RepID=A0A0E9MW48_9BACT|nr:hypothetical protein FPE01S_01_09620 [Flavihumibacter petaseus NBRC 106054]
MGENFIVSSKTDIYLIDWEYSGMNNPIWDLASYSLENSLSYEEEKLFLETYYELTALDTAVYRSLEYLKALQDLLWYLWAELKTQYGQDCKHYGLTRYNRAKLKINKL